MAQSISDALGIACPGNTVRLSTPFTPAEPQPAAWSFIAVNAAVPPTRGIDPAGIGTARCVKIIRAGSGYKASFNGNSPDTTS
jgi:hypothetical protein